MTCSDTVTVCCDFLSTQRSCVFYSITFHRIIIYTKQCIFFIEIRKVFLCKSKKVWTSALLRLVHIASCTKHTQTTLFDYVPHVFLIGGDRQNSSKLKAGTTAWALWSFSVFTALLTASVEGVVIRLIGSPQEAFTHTSQLPLTQIS